MAALFEAIFDTLFGTIFYVTGEIVLFAVTLGRHKPRWDFYTKESPSTFVILSELSAWVGIVFWLAVLTLGTKLLL